jgi:hypothetical protein
LGLGLGHVLGPRTRLDLGELGSRRQQRRLRLQQLGGQGALVEHRQRVALVHHTAHVDRYVLEQALRARHDVDLARRLDCAGVAQDRADRSDADRHGAHHEPHQ